MFRCLSCALSIFVTLLFQACAQTRSTPSTIFRPPEERTDPSAEPEFLTQYARTYRFRLGWPRGFTTTPDGKTILFLRSGGSSFEQQLFAYDVARGQERLIGTVDELLKGAPEQISTDEQARRERTRQAARGIVSYQLSRDGQYVLIPLSGRMFLLSLSNGRSEEIGGAGSGAAATPRLSPDGVQVAYVRSGDLFVYDRKKRREWRLTKTATRNITNGLAEFVAQEEMERHRGFWWSPDGRSIVYQQTNTSEVGQFYISDAANSAKRPRARAYPRPGSANARVRLGIVSRRGGKTRWVQWDQARYPYLVAVRWRENSPLTIVVENRKQTELVVLVVNARTGRTRAVVFETDPSWVNIDPQMPRWLSDGKRFLWTSERRGARQLELRGRGGELLSVLTKRELGYRKLVDVDEKRGRVTVVASTRQPEAHLYRISLATASPPPQRISDDGAVHDAFFGEWNHDIFVHWIDPLAGNRQIIVRDSSGQRRGQIASSAEVPPFPIRAELLSVGQRPRFNVAVVRPRATRKKRKYPICVYVYGGPRHTMVRASKHAYILQQWIADHGYIVVSIDGRGTPWRGRRWERAIKGNLIDVPLDDQVAGLRLLAVRLPELDLTRVGIFGWSFGGYVAAMAALRQSGVFHAAVAGAPVTDWMYYDTHYTERYLGLPSDNVIGYRKSSVLTYATERPSPLLLVHGTADDNVYFSHSVMLSNALFRSGHYHEFLPLSDYTHMVTDPAATKSLYGRIMAHLNQHVRDRWNRQGRRD